MNKNLHQKCALFMILLVLTIPYLSAITYAATGSLTNLNVTGKDGFRNVIRQEQDSVQVVVDATILNVDGVPLEVKKENVFVNFNKIQENANDCVLGEESIYTCIYASQPADYKAAVLPLVVTLFDKSFQLLDKKTEQIVVDSEPPSGSVSVKGKITLETDFELAYTVEDTACDDPECKSKCSGIDVVELYAGKDKDTLQLVLTEQVAETQQCSATKSITTNVQQLGLQTGDVQFCLKASDKFGNVMDEPSCVVQPVDYQAPSIIKETFRVYDPATNGILTHKKNVATTVDLKINITDDVSKITADKVTANFAAFNPAQSFVQKYKSIAPDTCLAHIEALSEFAIYECTWKNIVIAASDQDTYEISITAKDDADNKAEEKFSVTIPTDNQGPAVTQLQAQYDGFLNPTNNTFLLTIDETGVGLFQKKVFMDIGTKKAQASACAREGSLWKCLFDAIPLSESSFVHGTRYLVQAAVDDSFDDLGNKFIGNKFSREFLFDNLAPDVENATIKPLGSDRTVLVGTGQDVALLTAFIVEKGGGEEGEAAGIVAERAFADFSAFDFTQGLTPATDCVELPEHFAATFDSSKEHLYKCTWEYAGPISEKKVKVRFLIVDNAGNSKSLEEQKPSDAIIVVDFKEVKRDVWEDELKGVFPSGKTYSLNRNFLWMSQQGTPLRATIDLGQTKSGFNSHVHEILISSCRGAPGRITKDEGMKEFAVQALNYPVESGSSFGNSKRNILITIPVFDKTMVKDKKELTIVCDGTIVQGTSKTSAIFTPNEPFKATFIVDLVDDLFSRPDNAALDSLIENKNHIENLESTLEVFEWMTKWLGGMCTIYAKIMAILNNTCVVVNGFTMAFGNIYPPLYSSDSQCKLQSDFLNDLWYGHKGDPKFKGFGMFKTDKKLASVGFWCDAFMCTQCDRAWKEMIAPVQKSNAPGFSLGLSKIPGMSYDPEKVGTVDVRDLTKDPFAEKYDLAPQITFDPQQNLIFATLCAPPCLPTIQKFLASITILLKTENKCRLTAVASGENPAICDNYYSYQVCDLLSTNLIPWYMVTDMVKGLFTQFIPSLIQMGLEQGICDGNFVSKNGICALYRVEAFLGAGFALSDIITDIGDIVNQFKSWGGGDEESSPSAGAADTSSDAGTTTSSSSGTTATPTSEPSAEEKALGVIPTK
ncbi:hypothetical protein HYY69_01265 [Candidatus Woesearchaeota archaeon]|nr:hypothetical protein [Candidatus Woesearchaeota archaeon]